jgi:hypothetical protein
MQWTLGLCLPILQGSPGNQASACSLPCWIKLIFTFSSYWCVPKYKWGALESQAEPVTRNWEQCKEVCSLSSHRQTFKFKFTNESLGYKRCLWLT